MKNIGNSGHHILTTGFILALGALLTLTSYAAPKPATIKQCKSKWVLSAIQGMNFGGFSIEAGSGSISMDRFGALTTTGLVSLSNSIPATTFTANVDNSKASNCASHGFTLDWGILPAPLTGPGSAMSLTDVRLSIPEYGLTDVSLPVTIAPNAGNIIPFTMVFYGVLSTSSPQAAGVYVSPQYTVELIQSDFVNPVSGTASATSFVPLTISELIAMDFGTVAGSPQAGAVVLDTNGSRFTTGGARVITSSAANAASFQVLGEPNQVYSLAFSDGTLANATGQLINLTSFTDNSLGAISASGDETFEVGATLNVGANQPEGVYSTSAPGGIPYTITINYN
jgi:hypothetical protein